MGTIIQFALLGLATGGIFALIGQSVVVVYRGSNVLNFAAGAIGMLGAYVFYRLWETVHVPWPVALAAAFLVAGAIGALMHLVIMRNLKSAPPISRIVATLGLLTALMAICNMEFAPNGITESVPSILPTGVWRFSANASVGVGQLVLAGVAVIVTAGLAGLQRFTRFGLATSAVAENRTVTASMGWSPDLVATMTWVLGSFIAALAIILTAPLDGLSVTSLALLVIPGMAAALIGKFESLWLTLVGAMIIGIGESEVSRFVLSPGWTQSAPLIVIVAVLVLRGSNLPEKSDVSLERLPSVGPGRVGWPSLVFLVGGIALVLLLSDTWLGALTNTLVMALIVLSVVVVSGFAGQLSLAGFELAGLAAFFTALFAVQLGFPMWAAMIFGIIVTVPLSVIMALPALRTRGSQLAIATLSLATVVDALVFNQPWTTKFVIGPTLPTLSLFGFNFNPVTHPRSFGLLVLAVFAIAAWMASCLRRGPLGRRLLAVRGNERAATALGISVPRMKIYAFAVAALIAAMAGALSEAQLTVADFSLFTVLGSINAVLWSVIGGIGWIAGAPVGAVSAPAALGSQAISTFFSPSFWLDLITGLSVIVVVLQSPSGLVPLNIELGRHILRRVGYRKQRDLKLHWEEPQTAEEWIPPTPATLSVEGLTVRFGGQLALDDVSVKFHPGEIVGLIGPNGAGKSTLIDAVCGFVRITTGSILLDRRAISRLPPSKRARLGIGRSFQSLELFEDMTVLDNLRTGSDLVRPSAYFVDLILPRRLALRPSTIFAIHNLRLASVLYRKPGELDYGRRRLTAIARTLASEPAIVFLDEPAAGLDADERRELKDVIRRVAAAWGIAIVVVEHDVNLVFGLCDRVVALDAGKIIAEGPPDEVRHNPALIAAFLGSAASLEPAGVMGAPTSGVTTEGGD